MAIIIFLNGISSSGKSSIAREIQKLGHAPYLHVKLDTFLRMVQPEKRSRDVTNAIISNFHQCLETLARNGNFMIIDHVLQDPGWLPGCLTALRHFNIYAIGVHCELSVAKQREINRGDRNIGTAAYQSGRVHAAAIYDLQVDTTHTSPASCAQAILDFVYQTDQPLAWKSMLVKNTII